MITVLATDVSQIPIPFFFYCPKNSTIHFHLYLTILQCFRSPNIYKNISISATLWRQRH